jgi:hypothetical protein
LQQQHFTAFSYRTKRREGDGEKEEEEKKWGPAGEGKERHEKGIRGGETGSGNCHFAKVWRSGQLFF